MAPKLRRDRQRWRRRARRWAAPVVLTVALGAGCTKDSKDKTVTTDQRPPITDTGGKGGTDAGAKTPAPAPDAMAQRVDKDPPPRPVIREIGRLYREKKDGPCTFDEDVQCSPDETCNPPPPYEVPCGAVPNQDDVRGRVLTSTTPGKCDFARDVECDPGTRCNPPMPYEIPCPY